VSTPQIEDQETVYEGKLVTVRRDTLRIDGRQQVQDVVAHPDSVAIVAIDDQDRILLIRQYRHPVSEMLWEVPAGLLDRPGETPLDGAHRELADESGYLAASWQPLVELHTSPGVLTERVQVWLAGDLSIAPGGAKDTLERKWVTLPHALDMVFAAEITNALSVAGILAAAHRKADTPR
jgi:ADP-ribose pyrophosphatase